MPAVAPLVGQVALSLAFTVGASVLANIFAPKRATPTTTVTTSRGISFELTVGESVPVSAVFGRGRAQGHLIFAQEYGADNEYLKVVIKCGRGWYAGFDAFLVDEQVRALSGSNSDVDGYVVDDFRLNDAGDPDPGGTPHMWVKAYFGTPGQVADPGLIAATSRWTSDHTLTGCPYLVVTIRQHPIFGSTLPRIGSVWQGLKLYDWRFDSTVPGGDGEQRWNDQSTWAWSENVYVIRYNFRRGYWINGVKLLGMGFSAQANDLDYYTAAANVADEAVSYPDTGATLARYAYGREIFDDEEHLDILDELDRAGCGASFDRGGADAPLPAAQQVAAVTFTDGDLLEEYAAQHDRWGAVSEKASAVHGAFVSAAEDWASRPYGIRVTSALEETIGGRRLTPYDQPFESRIERAQGRAEIALRRHLYAARRTEVFGPRSNVLEVGDCISRQMGDWGTMLALVESVEPLPKRIGNRVTWHEWNNLIVPASGDSFLSLPAGPGAGPQSPDRTIAVSSLSVVPYSRSSGGAVLPFARASWAHIADPNVTQVKIVLWPAAGTEASDAEEFLADARLSDARLCGPLAPTTDFEGYAIPVRRDNRTCVPTSFSLTSGELTVPAELADGSVTLAKLAQELKNAHGLVVGDDQSSLAAAITRLEEKIAEQAAANITDQNTNATRTTLLKALTGKALAAVATEATARVEADAALAGLIDTVVAAFGDALAEGLLQFDATVTGAGASAVASILLKVRAVVTDAAEAALRLIAESDGVGGAIASIQMMADRLVFISTAGTVVGTPFRIIGGVIYLDQVVIQWADIMSAVVANFVATSANLGSASVTNAKIGSAAVQTANIADLNVSTIKIANGAVSATASNTGSNVSNTTSIGSAARASVSLATTFPVVLGGRVTITNNDTSPPPPGFSHVGDDNFEIDLYRDGSERIANVFPLTFIAGGGASATMYIGGVALPPDGGSHTYQLYVFRQSNPSGLTSITSPTITAVYPQK